MSVLEIHDLHVSVDTESGPTEILRGVDLTVKAGETHAIMGPNGSGKSTLAYSIAGHPKYTVTAGTVTLDGEDVLAMTVDERARAGLFLAMQYPVEVPGVSVANFLRTAKTAVSGEAPKLRTWIKDVNGAMDRVKMDTAMAQRSVNEGFSGGEKKRHEIVQLELLDPKVAILDETDSGLDIDALKIVSEGEIDDQTIECWLHGSRFDLVSGRPTGLPATKPVPVYPVKIDGDDVLVSVTNGE